MKKTLDLAFHDALPRRRRVHRSLLRPMTSRAINRARERTPTLLACALTAGLLALAAWPAAAGDVFVNAIGGYNTYRIPAIVRATNGTLLAFCEGRPSSSDTGNIDIVLKRSTDNGATWGSLTVVRDEGTDSATNPGPVVDESTGRVFLHYSKSISLPFYMFSDDNGGTWSAPVEITATAKAAGWGYCVPGPGHGIQLKRGAQASRLLVPFHHYLTSGAKGIHAVYSDDHGATWSYGSVANAAGGINPDECLAVELVSPAAGGGSQVYFNIRDESGSAAGNRTVGWSTNGGTTLNLPLTNDTRFVTPIVQGSVLRMRATDEGDAINVILFSCPNHASSRENMSVWYSTDEGANWSAPRSIFANGAAYSDMACLTDRTVGLLYEKEGGKITFTNFGPDFLGLGATWDSTASIGWGTAASWVGDVTPAFNNQLDVYFCAPATTKFANNIGTAGVPGINRTIRSLNFNANADSNATLELQSANVSGTLTFDTDTAGGNAALIVDAGSAGSHTVGINNFGSIILADHLLVTHHGSGTLTIGRAVSGTGKSLTKAGAGTLVLSGANTYSGGTAHNGGIIVAGNNSALGPGTFTMTNAPRLVVNDGITITNNIMLNGAGGVTGRGLIENSGTGNATLSGGPITINGASGAGGHFASASGGSLTILNPINSSSVAVSQRTGTVIYGGGGSYTNLSITGTAKLAANNGLATGAIVSLGSSGNATLDLAGYSLQLAGINRVANTCTITNSSTSADATLRVNAGSASTYSGVIVDGNAANRRIHLVKSGTDTLTLSGTNTYSGTTTVSNGLLRLTHSQTLASNSSVALVMGGTLDLAFVGTNRVTALSTNANPLANGIYGSNSLPALITGGGYLKVGTGPAVGFTGGPASGYAPLTVNFTNSSAADGGVITNCLWSFGDASPTNTPTVVNVAHTYAGAGAYTVSLTVRDNAGQSNTVAHSNMISVWAVPQPTFAGGSEFSLNPINGQALFNILTTNGVKYRITYKDDLLSTSGWQPVIPTNWTSGTNNGPFPLLDTSAAGVTQRFYRIEAKSVSAP
ncbi:MAG: exo-alpha-sialidase [Kiritimatiellaeota bacterium]|nr:exo-alpha-sialidase [Kiritimatiellota bacterium]